MVPKIIAIITDSSPIYALKTFIFLALLQLYIQKSELDPALALSIAVILYENGK